MHANPRMLVARARRMARRTGLSSVEPLLSCAWREAVSTGEDLVQADVAHELATVYRTVGDRRRAEKFARLAIKFETRVGRDELLADRLMLLAELLAQSGRLEQALLCAEYGLECYVLAHGGEAAAPVLQPEGGGV